MSESSLQTKLRQAWYTSMVTIIGIAVLAVIIEVALGSKPTSLLQRVGVMRDGAQQIRLELALLGRLLADDPSTYPADLPQRLAGLHSSMARGLSQMGVLKDAKPDDFKRLEALFREQFLPDFVNFSHPVGDQDRGLIRERLKGSLRELEIRLAEVEHLLSDRAGSEVGQTGSIKFMSAVGGCALGLIGMGLLFAQNRGIQGAVQKAIREAAPVVGADSKLAENIAKYAARIRELESANKTLRSEVDKLAPLADEVVTLRQQPDTSPWEAFLTAIHGRARSTLGKRGELGLVLELSPEEIKELEEPLRKHTEFVRITTPPPSDQPARSRHAVLVVEKDPTQRARLLSCMTGLDLEVLNADAPDEGWSLLNRSPTVRLCLVGIENGSNAGAEFGQRIKADPRHKEVEVVFCSPFMDTRELTQTLKKVAESKTPLEEAQEKTGLTTHAYGKMLQTVNTETRETLTYARTALSHGQRNAAWNRISSLKDTAAAVGDKSLNHAIAAVEREMDRGDVFFITNELERLERENQRLSKLAQQLLTSAPKTMSAEDIAAAGGTPGKATE